jgi:PAS domain S-box-containing protein
MKTGDKGKTKAQLIKELQALRRQLAELQGREDKRREQVEESPLREHDMLHVLMENVPDWIFFKDAESRIVRSNRAHAQLVGFDDPREAVGKTDFDLFPREDAQRFYDEEQRMLQSGQSVVARLGQTPSSDGEVLWVSETKIPLKDETGQVIGLVGISRDVTEIKRAEEVLKEAHAEIEKQVEERTAELKREIAERKRAEAALARESELLQALLDNSPDYIFFKDRESRFIKTNKAHAQNLLGVSDPSEVAGKTDFDLYPGEEENTQRFYDEEQRLMETGEPVIGREWTVPSQATGEEVWLSEHKVPIRGEDGEVVGLVCIGRDVTQLKRAEAALVRERDLMRTLLNSSPDYIFFKDRESRFIMSNDAHAQQLLDLDNAREAVGKTDFDLFSHREAQRFYDEEQKIMETGQPVIGREWSLHSSTTGEEVWLSEHKVPIRDETGQVIGLLGISRDVTQLKRAAAEREQLLTTLERRSVQLQAAADVSSAASSMLDPNELIQKVVNLVRERFDLYYVGLFLVDQTSSRADKWAVLRAGTGEAGRRMVKQRHELRVSEGHSMVGECIATGEARVEQDVSKAAVHRRNPLLPDTRSELALPLISRGEAIGALTVQSAEPLAFTEEDVSILQTMAGQVANAIENTRLYKQTEEALKELETIHRSYIRRSWDSYIKRSG